MIITFWKKDAVALRDNVNKALEMSEKLPQGEWRAQIRLCLENAVKYLAKGKLHGQDTDNGKPESNRVAKA